MVRALAGRPPALAEDAIGRLLDAEDVEVLFVAGCEENQVRFHPRFDLIILLSAPAGVLAERRASRTGNSFGRGPGPSLSNSCETRDVDDPSEVEQGETGPPRQ